MTKALDDAFGLPTIIETNTDLEVVKETNTDEQSIEDQVDEAKEHIISARDLALQAVQDMMNIAQQSQHPKSYEVLNALIKTYAEVSGQPIDIEIKKLRLTGSKPKEEQPTVNNNLFVGSTAELMKLLNGESPND